LLLGCPIITKKCLVITVKIIKNYYLPEHFCRDWENVRRIKNNRGGILTRRPKISTLPWVCVL
jgi:hypothetical protein